MCPSAILVFCYIPFSLYSDFTSFFNKSFLLFWNSEILLVPDVMNYAKGMLAKTRYQPIMLNSLMFFFSFQFAIDMEMMSAVFDYIFKGLKTDPGKHWVFIDLTNSHTF